MRKNLNDHDFVFIVAAQRSGTNLLLLMLQSHFSISIPIETRFIPLFQRYRFLWGNLKKYTNRKRMLECIYDFLEIWTRRSGEGTYFDKIIEFSVLKTRGKAESILKRSRSYPDIVNTMFYEYAISHGKSSYGDKYTNYDAVPVEIMDRSVPEAKIIHLIRDGRDVALSMMNVWFAPKTMGEAFITWDRHIDRIRTWGKKHTDRYMEVKYEDLLSKPEEVMKTVGEFIGLEYDANVEFHDLKMASILSTKKNMQT